MWLWIATHYYPEAAGVATGAFAGIGQWLVLRKSVRRAGWWILSSIVGMTAAMAGFSVLWVGQSDGQSDYLVSALGGAMYGMITGIVLVLLLRYPVPGTSQQAQDTA
jgi:hypothetical protein